MEQKYLFLGFALSLGLSFYAGAVHAFVVMTGDEITVPKSEVVDDTLLAAGQSITVDADINGDLICAGQNVNINGNVNGDVLCAAQNITVKGSIAGSVRGLGQTVKIEGPVAKNISVAGQTVSADSLIEGEMAFAAQQASIGGDIKKDVAGVADSMTVSGVIDGNTQFAGDNLTLKNGGAMGGRLDYTSDNEAAREENFVVAGAVTRHDPPKKEIGKNISPVQKSTGEMMTEKIQSLILNLAVALLLVFFFKKFITKSTDAIMAKTGRSFAWGLLILIAGPLLIISLFLTLIGIPLAVIALLLYIAAIFVSRLLAAIAAGRIIVKKIWKDRPESLYLSAIVGVAVFWILFALPVIGWIVSAAAMVWGLGGIFYLFKKSRI